MVDVEDTPTKHGLSNQMANNIRTVRARYVSKVFGKEFILTFIVDGILYERHLSRILPAFRLWSGKQFKGTSQYVLENGLRRQRRLKNELIFYLRISRYPEIFEFVSHCQNYLETEYGKEC